jgi:hypothetical protein
MAASRRARRTVCTGVDVTLDLRWLPELTSLTYVTRPPPGHIRSGSAAYVLSWGRRGRLNDFDDAVGSGGG